MDVGHMLGQTQVILRVTLVPYEPEQVEPREQGSWKLDVGLRRLLDVVAAKGRVGSSQDGHTSIQGGHDASLE